MRCSGFRSSGSRCKLKINLNIEFFCRFVEDDIFCRFHEKEDCSICMEKINNKIILCNCGHKFCKCCIYRWLFKSNTCPLCRQPVYQDEIDSSLKWGYMNKLLLNVRYVKFDINTLDQEEKHDFLETCNIELNTWITDKSFIDILNSWLLHSKNTFALYYKMISRIHEYIQFYDENDHGIYSKEKTYYSFSI